MRLLPLGSWTVHPTGKLGLQGFHLLAPQIHLKYFLLLASQPLQMRCLPWGKRCVNLNRPAIAQDKDHFSTVLPEAESCPSAVSPPGYWWEDLWLLATPHSSLEPVGYKRRCAVAFNFIKINNCINCNNCVVVVHLCCWFFIHPQSGKSIFVNARGTWRPEPTHRMVGGGQRLYWRQRRPEERGGGGQTGENLHLVLISQQLCNLSE